MLAARAAEARAHRPAGGAAGRVALQLDDDDYDEARCPPPACRPPPLPRTNRTSLIPPPVLSGHAASLTPYSGRLVD